MSTTTKLCKDAFGKNVERKIYRSMIGSLLYLTVSRLDISFSIGAYARYLRKKNSCNPSISFSRF